jgi:hypothetical protein
VFFYGLSFGTLEIKFVFMGDGNNGYDIIMSNLLQNKGTNKKSAWPESESELYRPSDRACLRS